MKHYLSIGAIFKNESHIMVEWLEHYLNEGAEHFYLIDNNSNDNYYEKLRPYIEKGLIDLFFDPKPKAQIELYNKYFANIPSHWIGIFDLDEFAYCPEMGKIKDFLEGKEDFDEILIPWLRFGSNGHMKQPPSVVKYFTMRQDYNKTKRQKASQKSILKTSAVNQYRVHYHKITGVKFDAMNNTGADEFNEETIKKLEIVINHYQVQSKELHENIRIPAGRLWVPYGNDYFTENDLNQIEDLTLSQKSAVCANRFLKLFRLFRIDL